MPPAPRDGGLVSVLYSNVAIVECADALALETLLKSGIEPFVVWRISDHAVVVDHDQVDELLKLLRRQGQTPRITLE